MVTMVTSKLGAQLEEEKVRRHLFQKELELIISNLEKISKGPVVESFT